MTAIVIVAALVRLLFPAADPPSNPTVGVVWHDEGAWVHNARNKALFGVWRTDAWNPMFVAPVFTALEYLSFEVFGVGVRQARLVSELSGLLSVVLLALGVRRVAGREAGLAGGALLATHHVYVMYNRAATMEASMVAFMVVSWYGYVRAQTRPAWGWLAASFALLSFFTKAAAAFFVAGLALEALVAALWGAGGVGGAGATSRSNANGRQATAAADLLGRQAGRTTLLALVVCGIVALAAFVLPNWTEYRFYNWQMSVTRKPSYEVRALLDRATWFPIAHDIFTRSWFIVVLAAGSLAGMLVRLRSLGAPERLLALWVALGALELVLHDVGNERRFVVFVPAAVALAAILLARDRRLLPVEIGSISRGRALLAAPLVLFGAYVVCGAIVRLAFLYEIGPGVRWSALAAAMMTGALYATWPVIPRWLSGTQWTPAAGLALAALVSAGQLAQFVQWAWGRSYKNYEASVALREILPPGTLVHGKLANGLALENGIRPVFVGRGFGNYEDRRRRDDVRYILTYVSPRIGYEGPVIQDVLDAYPTHSILLTFDVAETSSGADRAALIDKFGPTAAGADKAGRAHD